MIIFNWYFANYHKILTIAIGNEIIDLKGNDEIKSSKLTLSKLSIIFLVVQISGRKPIIHTMHKNIHVQCIYS